MQGLSGDTRWYALIGDPIAQVKAPEGLTRAMRERGHDVIVVPVHVRASEVDALLHGFAHARNLDGILATVPHKFTAFRHCTTTSNRAHVLHAANMLRRTSEGGWHGEMLDGLGMIAALRAAGCEPSGQRALVVGAGGAGSAIALALLDAGVESLVLHDADHDRRDALMGRLSARYPGKTRTGSADPAGATLVVNATPAGMKADDPLPVRTDALAHDMFVADVITRPVITPLLAAAGEVGCRTVTGVDMFNAEIELMVEFFLGHPHPAP